MAQEGLGPTGSISPDEQTRAPLVSVGVIRKSAQCLVEDFCVISCSVGAGVAGA